MTTSTTVKVKDDKLVSVIVPIYNASRFLTRCVESITSQDYRNIQLILVDDGSIDNSYEICTRLADDDSRITVVNQENAGVSAARNVGISLAKGKWLTFVDSDDELLPGAITNMVDLAIREDAECVRTSWEETPSNKKIGDRERSWQGLYENSNVNLLIVPFSCGDLMCYSGLLLIETRVLKEYSIKFPADVSMMEDMWFYIDLMGVVRSIYIDTTTTYRYYIHPESATKSIEGFSDKMASVVRVNSHIRSKADLSLEDTSTVNARHLSIITSLFMVRADRMSWRDTFAMLREVPRRTALRNLYRNSDQRALDVYNRLAVHAFIYENIYIIGLLKLIRKISGK